MHFPDKLLRPWRPEDAPVVLEAATEPFMSYQFREPVRTLEDAEQWIAHWMAEETAHVFAVLHDGEPVGNVAVSRVDLRHQTGWVSYWLMERARGKGLASQACRTLASWAFDELGLFRLELGHRVDNVGSCRVAVAAGFAAEGFERSRLRYDGVRHDVERHARLATDQV